MGIKIDAKHFRRLAHELEHMKLPAEKVISNTISDMRSSTPGIVADEVRKVYNIKKGEITPNRKGKKLRAVGNINFKGQTIDTLELVYRGRVLTPTHFGMTPKTRTKRNRRTPIKAEIKKGSKKILHPNAFLGTNKGGGYIPFRRLRSTRLPIEAIKTLSLPQMITNSIVMAGVEHGIDSRLSARLQHHMERFMKE